MALLRNGEPLGLRQQVKLTALLALPSMLAMVSHVMMEYIDAAMVGSLGADASASVGLVATSAWMVWGLCSSAAAGFSVQVAHLVGAKNNVGARQVVRQGIVTTIIFSLLVLTIATSVTIVSFIIIFYFTITWFNIDIFISINSHFI